MTASKETSIGLLENLLDMGIEPLAPSQLTCYNRLHQNVEVFFSLFALKRIVISSAINLPQ